MKKLLPLNLQFFGENDEAEKDEKEPAKSYSEEEYLKLKNSFDKASSELAKMKQEAKAKLSEEEQKKLADQELAEKMAKYEDELDTYKLKGELQKNNVFESSEVDEIVELKNDKNKMLSKISEIVTKKIEDAKKQAIQDFMQQSKAPTGGNGNGSNVDPTIQKIIDSQKNVSSGAANARKFYLGEKGE